MIRRFEVRSPSARRWTVARGKVVSLRPEKSAGGSDHTPVTVTVTVTVTGGVGRVALFGGRKPPGVP